MPTKNQQTINEFLLYTLNLGLSNRTWSWDAYGDDVVVLKLWKKLRETLPDGTERIEVWAPPPWKKPATAARRERRKNIDRLKAGGATYAVLRSGDGSHDRDSWDYERDGLYKLGHVIVDTDDHEYAIVEGWVSVDEFLTRGSALEIDLADIAARYADHPTTREALVAARLGQGRYRANLLALWDDRCAVTGIPINALLRASHARPWRDSDDEQRLDPENGLPLVANLDSLFDAGLIAFTATGDMMVSSHIPPAYHAALGLPARLRKRPTSNQARHLKYHADHVFKHGKNNGE